MINQRPTDEDFEVVEEVIEDFDYFYEDEDEIIRNAKVIRKLKMTSVLITAVVLFFVVLFTGMVQMKVYETDKIVTKDTIVQIEYKENVKEAYEYAMEFYNEQTINNEIKKNGLLYEIEKYIENNPQFLIEDLEDNYLFGIMDKCNEYIGETNIVDDGYLEKIEIPNGDKYEVFNSALVDTYITIYNICVYIQNNRALPNNYNSYLQNQTLLGIAYLAIQ